MSDDTLAQMLAQMLAEVIVESRTGRPGVPGTQDHKFAHAVVDALLAEGWNDYQRRPGDEAHTIPVLVIPWPSQG